MLYNTSLWFHITGICLMAGVTVVDFILTKKFWSVYAKNPQQGILVKQMTNRLPLLIIAGIVLILLSGVGIMAATNGVFDTMLWFRIKMVLVLFVILNSVINGRRLGGQLNRLLASGIAQSPNEQPLSRLRKGLNVFYISQLILFFIIFFLSTFKFN
jgi:uncharacterized membrane protein